MPVVVAVVVVVVAGCFASSHALVASKTAAARRPKPPRPGGRPARQGTLATVPEEDEALVAKELGYYVPNLLGVAAWTSEQTPAAIATYPLKRDKGQCIPFPTSYWLANDRLSVAVSGLERDGGVGAARDSLTAEDVADLKVAHERYRVRRWSLLTPEDRALVVSRGWESALKDVGIAGLHDHTRVKCLHAHYAHFLGDAEHPRNPIGRWVHAHLPEDIRAFANVNEASSPRS